MSYILLTAFMGCAIAALGARRVFYIMLALPAAFVVLWLTLNSPLSPWCTTCAPPKVQVVEAKPSRWVEVKELDTDNAECTTPLVQSTPFMTSIKDCKAKGGKVGFNPDAYLRDHSPAKP